VQLSLAAEFPSAIPEYQRIVPGPSFDLPSCPLFARQNDVTRLYLENYEAAFASQLLKSCERKSRHRQASQYPRQEALVGISVNKFKQESKL
jgi:hypothetical protein